MNGEFLATKVEIDFRRGDLTSSEQSVLSEGFYAHTLEEGAPQYTKERVKWLALDESGNIKAALTADILWDWVYIDELWICPKLRGEGLGRRLMNLAEEFAISQKCQGIWLWTQSWQADGFYSQVGYSQFTRFDDFPKGHSRIGFRKKLT